jgi:hypothetical protein
VPHPAKVAAERLLRATPTLSDAVSYSGLVDTLARSLDRLERAADSAASDNAVAALAAVAGQIHKAVEIAARLAGLDKSPDEIPGAPAGYSLRIVFSGNKAPTVIEGTAAALPPADAEDDVAGEILAAGPSPSCLMSSGGVQGAPADRLRRSPCSKCGNRRPLTIRPSWADMTRGWQSFPAPR